MSEADALNCFEEAVEWLRLARKLNPDGAPSTRVWNLHLAHAISAVEEGMAALKGCPIPAALPRAEAEECKG